MRIAVPCREEKIPSCSMESGLCKLYIESPASEQVKYEYFLLPEKEESTLLEALRARKVDTLLCGTMTPGQQAVLEMGGIRVFSGLSGSCDRAVLRLLRGELSEIKKNDSCGKNCENCGECRECKEGCGEHE